ncbi:MAG TPA: hypothetical protein DEH00_00490, partial [Candidatus Marinimicrobia bacterium]|nr:hypothetical protein [Candidatus Neomarinimicrobiota bacterium]
MYSQIIQLIEAPDQSSRLCQLLRCAQLSNAFGDEEFKPPFGRFKNSSTATQCSRIQDPAALDIQRIQSPQGGVRLLHFGQHSTIALQCL